MLQCCHIILYYEILDQNLPVCWSIDVKQKPTVDLFFFGGGGAFHSDCILKATEDVNVYFFIDSSNSCKLYQRIR
jgi:hypothetical protein